MKNTLRKSIFGVVMAVLIGALGWYLWQQFAVDKSAQDFVSSNGRLEATEIKVAAKMAGRVDKILVNEGDLVQQNDVLAVMELTALQAQLLQAQAEAARAVSAKEAAIAQVAQRSADIAVADAVLLQRASEQNLAQKTKKPLQVKIKRCSIRRFTHSYSYSNTPAAHKPSRSGATEYAPIPPRPPMSSAR